VRVVLCTSGGRPGAAVLARLRACRGLEVAGVVVSTRIVSARYGRARGAWEHIRLSGLRYALYLGCYFLRSLPAQGLPVFATRDVNSAQARAFLARLAPDLLISAFFNQRIGAGLAGFNLHPSLLPRLRGVDPVFHARLRGEPLGVTLHRLAPELDAGEIVAQRAAPTLAAESVAAATVRLYTLGADLAVDSLEALRAGGRGVPQAGAGGYDSWPDRGAVAALRAKGVSLVTWRDLLAPAA
jgi:methionyl-tRNA formyltransferase